MKPSANQKDIPQSPHLAGETEARRKSGAHFDGGSGLLFKPKPPSHNRTHWISLLIPFPNVATLTSIGTTKSGGQAWLPIATRAQALTLAYITRAAKLLGRIHHITETILHLESVYLPNAILH